MSTTTTTAFQPRQPALTGRAILRRSSFWICVGLIWTLLLPFTVRTGLVETLLGQFGIGSNFALSLFIQVGIAVMTALSFNMLLGHGGMLSFGHAVFSGLGGFFVIHAMNDSLYIPLELLPLVGGVAGCFFALLFGSIATRRSATAFAMITLGLGELMSNAAFMLEGFFGGETGVSGDRMDPVKLLPFTYGSNLEVYYLTMFWTLVAGLLMWLQTQTPLGRMMNAVRDNAERAQFIGYDPNRVRLYQFALSGLFAGMAGGMFAISQELVNSEAVSLHQSSLLLLMVTIGGIGIFYGPIVGAMLVTVLQSVLSLHTSVWMLYFGMTFLLVVLFMPGGIAGFLNMHLPVLKAGMFGRLIKPYLLAFIPLAVLLAGSIMLTEMIYALTDTAGSGTTGVWWIKWNQNSVMPWLIGGVLLVAGGVWFRYAYVAAQQAWNSVNTDLKAAEALQIQAEQAGAA